MTRLNFMSLLLVILISQSVLAQKMVNNTDFVYDAQLSDYKYDFYVSYFSINSQRHALKMAYI
jgi:hypothetical protein